MNNITIHLIDINKDMTDVWKRFFANMTNIQIHNIDLHTFLNTHDVQGIVSPANSFGLMDGGYDKYIIDYFGKDLMNNVQNHILKNYYGEQPVGTSFTIPIDDRHFLIHTPTMRRPGKIKDPTIIYSCMRSVLIECMQLNINSVLIPAFGGCTGGVSYCEIANMMRLAYEQIINVPDMITWDNIVRFEDYKIIQYSHAEGYCNNYNKDEKCCTNPYVHKEAIYIHYRLEDDGCNTIA